MSQYGTILNSVKDVILSVRTDLSHDQVIIRKRPEFRKGHDALPVIFVCPEHEIINNLQFNNNAFIDYPVVVVVIQENDLDIQSLDWQLDVREALRLTLYKPTLAGATDVFDCDYDPQPIFETAALERAFDVSVQKFTFRISEARASA